MTPMHILAVRCSWNTKTPKNIAVNGSNAPRIAVVVEPTSFIDIVIVSSEIIVGNIDSPIAKSHKKGLSKICSSVQNFRLIIYTKRPNNIT